MRQLLINTLGIQSYSYETKRMEAYILEQVKDMGVEVVYHNGNIYITKGDARTYPCIVSHTDSVHKIIDDRAFTIIADDEFAIGFDRLKMTPTGCGGDDKVGIAICLQALQDFDCIKVAFFRDEEVGCVGSYEANLDFFSDCRFVLQCDRRGNGDFVDEIYGTPLQSKAFKKDVKNILKRYGYKTTSGALTDVYALKQLGLNISVANMSCGYYNPHQDDEVVCFDDVFNCYKLVHDIMRTMTKTYEHTAETRSRGRSYGGYNYGGWDDWGYYGDTYTKDNKAVCECCANVVPESEMSLNPEFNEWVCASCNKWLEEETNFKIIKT